jgi:uncharacterized protein YndB with AHSA1/START domain
MSETKITAAPGMPLVIVTREFDAPRDLVFRAYTEPGLLVQWLGPRPLIMTIDEYDVRDGGRWRYLHATPEGDEHWFHGYFHGTPSAAAGIVQTFEYEGVPGHVQLGTVTFEERDGKTLVRTVSSFQSVQDRDGMVAANMEWGVRDGNERLAELLERLQVKAVR